MRHSTDQIAAFQGHHQFPWTITARGPANNLYKLTKPIIPQLALLLLLPTVNLWTTFYSTFLILIVVSQETHRQAHMVRPERWAQILQSAGVIVSQNAHAAHHRGAFDNNYCILSGICNPLLDRTRFFRWLEAIIFIATGSESNCWHLDARVRDEAMGKVKLLMDLRKGIQENKKL